MENWEEIVFLLKETYKAIGKDSIVTVEGETYMIKRIDKIILFDEAINEPHAVQVYARGIKVPNREYD